MTAANSSVPYGQAACALLLGMIGGAAHLLVVRWRAGLLERRGPAAVRGTFSLGLLGPVAVMLIAIRFCPRAAWLVPLGLLALRWLVLGRRSPFPEGGRP